MAACTILPNGTLVRWHYPTLDETGELTDRQREFLASVIVRPGQCFGWTGHVDRNGYAKFGKFWAHRVAHELFIGPIPSGYHVDHVRAKGCTSRVCTNWDHLEAVTQAENNRRAAEGRERRQTCKRGHPLVRGKTQRWCPVCRQAADITRARQAGIPPKNKLRPEDVLAIRTRYAAGGVSHQALADEYGVSRRQVGNVVTGKQWRELTEAAS